MKWNRCWLHVKNTSWPLTSSLTCASQLSSSEPFVTTLINNSMKLFSWGANTYSQLGHGVKSEQCALPHEIAEINLSIDLSTITSIIGGGGHSLALDRYGDVYACGWNTKGQLGLPMDSDVLTFQKLILPKKYKVRKLSCGWDASAAVTEDGQLLEWGSNAYGQLGLPKTEIALSAVPLEVPVPKVWNIAMGLRHTAMLTLDGKVLVCGDGRKGQLGLTDNSGTSIKQTDKPTEVSGLTDVQSIACGQYHTIALTSKGQCYVWGDNKHGQLGLDPAAYPVLYSPMEISVLPDRSGSIATIATGWTHTNMLTENGTIINCGRNTYGQLGCHSFQRPVTWKPQLLNTIKNVKQLAVGSEHNIALLENGQVFSWGWNEHGNCGVGTIEDIHFPTNVVIGLRYKVVLIGAGAGHCFAIVELC